MFKFIVQPDNTSKITKPQTTPVLAQKPFFNSGPDKHHLELRTKIVASKRFLDLKGVKGKRKFPTNLPCSKYSLQKRTFFNLQFILTKILLGFYFKRWKMSPSTQWCVATVYLFTPIPRIVGNPQQVSNVSWTMCAFHKPRPSLRGERG